jgi:hypothetical protein
VEAVAAVLTTRLELHLLVQPLLLGKETQAVMVRLL